MKNPTVLGLCFMMFACAGDDTASERIRDPWRFGYRLEAAPQAEGDPELGKELLLNGNYMTCGIPYKLWESDLAGPIVREQLSGALGGSEDAPRLMGRTGHNADMPYFLNAFTAPDDAVVINGNCFSCHAGEFNGELITGMGNATADFTTVGERGAGAIPLDDDFLAAFGLTVTESAHLKKMASRAKAMEMATMRTIGMNPAEMFAVILSGHHDLETLAWSDEWLTPLRVVDKHGNEIEDPLVTSDPPPWWRVKKKNALFYNGMARGDHRGTMALATSVCVDDVARAKEVDAQFLHIQSYVKTFTAPAYPFEIDASLAAEGEEVFLRDCAGCHGTYGEDDEQDTYPNLLIPLSIIGTDPVVANAGVIHSPHLVEWYNKSFYGKVTPMLPDDPFPGYMPPPLDGIWATGPFFHNGSVPTIELVLNSKARPKYWKRVDYDSRNFDEEALGWPFEAVPYPQAEAPPGEQKHIYDTTYWSQSNRGHTFGDHLSAQERSAVLEYLKTL